MALSQAIETPCRVWRPGTVMTSSIGSRFLQGASIAVGWVGFLPGFWRSGKIHFFDCLLLVYFVASGPLWWRLTLIRRVVFNLVQSKRVAKSIPSPCLTLKRMALWNLVFPLNKGQTMQKNFYIPDPHDIPMISPWYPHDIVGLIPTSVEGKHVYYHWNSTYRRLDPPIPNYTSHV